jgi:LysR family transcriptional regulator, transcription activator of glutamate synthase operon
LEVRIAETEANAIFAALQRGDAELGLVREPFVDSDLFHFLPICEDEVVAVVPPQHRLAAKGEIDLGELRGERFILLDKPTLLHHYFVELCRRRGFEPDIALVSTHSENVLEMVASGLGVSLMMRRVVARARDLGVRSLALTERVPSLVGFSWLREANLTHAARRFLDTARRHRSM